MQTVEREAGELEGAATHPAALRAAADAIRFEAVYDEHLDFVWRSLRRLGADESAVDDLVQEVFLVVHRRLASFEWRSSMKTWLFGIVLGIVRNHRRGARRKHAVMTADSYVDARAPSEAGPDASFERNEALWELYRLLDELDEDKRAVFVLAELEQMSAPEIAQALSANVNTVYSRLRAARRAFEEAVARYHSSDEGRPR